LSNWLSNEVDERFFLDAAAVRRAFNRASRGFAKAAVLHNEVRQRALERLLLLRQPPQLLLDLGSGAGGANPWLQNHLPRTRIISVDSALRMLQEAPSRSRWLGLRAASSAQICASANALPFREAIVDCVFSNLMLPWSGPPEPVFSEVRRVLRPGGVFNFTAFGPDTLRELRQAWREVDGQEHALPFMDMHDIGDALVRSGFAEPVLDVEHFTLTYSDVQSLLRELKASGSTNALPLRSRGLTGRNKSARFASAYERFREQGRLPVTCEIIYAQAWQTTARNKPSAPLETRIAVESLRGRRR
jgi:malonyl-CoA O-methyltransferase